MDWALDMLKSDTSLVLAMLGLIGWWVRRTLNNTINIEVRQGRHEERLDAHEKRHDRAEDRLDEYGNRISALEHPSVRAHPTLQGETYHP